jgi:hypothetical protein
VQGRRRESRAHAAMLLAPAHGRGLNIADGFGDETHGRDMENLIILAICILGLLFIVFHGSMSPFILAIFISFCLVTSPSITV